MSHRLAGVAVVLATASQIILVQEATAAPTPPKILAGKIVFLDPGHQGGADGNSLTKQVPDGRGGMKDCQTTGATSVHGLPEHTVNWRVTQLIKAGLESQGARVLLSRQNDTGWGGCVDERAAAASASKANIAVSIHSDSTAAEADSAKRGFHLIIPQLPLPDAVATKVQGGEGRRAAATVRDSLKAAGIPTANYAGVDDGLQLRSDIAAVNLTKVPAAFVEMGNLANPAEATALGSPDGQLKYALAITDGIMRFLTKTNVAQPINNTNPNGGLDPSLPGTPATPVAPAQSQGIDLGDLSTLGPLLQKITNAKDPASGLATAQDSGSVVLKAMLSVVYSVFGGKLPI